MSAAVKLIKQALVDLRDHEHEGIQGFSLQSELFGAQLLILLEDAPPEAHEAAVLAYRLGLAVATVHARELKLELDGARERAKAFDWINIIRMAHAKGWELPLAGIRKKMLRDAVIQKYGISEKSWQNHYPRAEAHAERVRTTARQFWLAERLSETCADGTVRGRADVSRAELVKLRADYKAQFGLDGRSFRKDLIDMGGWHYTNILRRPRTA